MNIALGYINFAQKLDGVCGVMIISLAKQKFNGIPQFIYYSMNFSGSSAS